MNSEANSFIVADAHPVFRQIIKNISQSISGLKLVAESESIYSLRSQLKHIKPDVLIIDFSMIEDEYEGVLRWFRTCFPRMNTIVVSSFDEPVYAETVLSLGAKAYLKKDSLRHTLGKSIESLDNHKLYVSTTLINQDLTQVNQNIAVTNALEKLNREEITFLDRFSQKPSPLDLAIDLNVTYEEVRKTYSNICKRLKISNQNQLLQFAKHNIQHIA